MRFFIIISSGDQTRRAARTKLYFKLLKLCRNTLFFSSFNFRFSNSSPLRCSKPRRRPLLVRGHLPNVAKKSIKIICGIIENVVDDDDLAIGCGICRIGSTRWRCYQYRYPETAMQRSAGKSDEYFEIGIL